jgi:hypothetical protein
LILSMLTSSMLGWLVGRLWAAAVPAQAIRAVQNKANRMDACMVSSVSGESFKSTSHLSRWKADPGSGEELLYDVPRDVGETEVPSEAIEIPSV